MIRRMPIRRRADLPDGHWVVVFGESDAPGARPIIVVSTRVTAGSRLERHLTRMAMRAWYGPRFPALAPVPAAAADGLRRLRAMVSPVTAAAMAATVAVCTGLLLLDLSTGRQRTESVSAPQPPTVSAPPATPAPARPAPRPPASPPERRPGRGSPGTGGTPAWTVSLPSHAGPRPHKTHKAHNAKPPAHPGHRPPGSGRHHQPGGGPPPRPPSWFLRDRGVHTALRLPGASAHIHAGVPCWRLLRLHARIGSLAGLRACL